MYMLPWLAAFWRGEQNLRNVVVIIQSNEWILFLLVFLPQTHEHLSGIILQLLMFYITGLGYVGGPYNNIYCSHYSFINETFLQVSQSSIGALATALLELGREDGADIVLGTSPLLQIVPPATDGVPGPPAASLANSKFIPESHPQTSGLAFSQGGPSPRRPHHASTGLSSASSNNMSR